MAKKKATTKKKKLNSYIKLDENVWPLEKDILYRPDRLKYVRKLIPEKGCVFCSAARKEASFETLCIYKSKYSMIVLNKYPYNSGHVLVLPLSHQGDMMALSEAAYMDLMRTLRLAMKAVTEIYQPGGINLGLNHGRVAGAGIPDHLHFHLIPRWSGDLNFFPLVADTKVVVESLEQTYVRLSQFLKTAKEV